MKSALIVGCAECLWDDVDTALSLGKYEAVYCVKMAGIYWPHKFQAWVSLHPEFMAGYQAERKERGYPDGYETVVPLQGEVGMHAKHKADRRVSYRFPGMNASASSGIYAAKVAMEDGYDRIVLAGIPMQAGQKHFVRGKDWAQCDAFQAGLKHAVPFLKDKVRSVSGLTQQLLGYPTPSWLAGEPQ